MYGSGAVAKPGENGAAEAAADSSQVSATQAWMERYTRRNKMRHGKNLRRFADSMPASTKFGDEVVSKVLMLARWRSKARKHADDRGFSMTARRPWLANFREVSERSGCVFGAGIEHDGMNSHVDMVLKLTHAEEDRRMDQAAEQRAKELTPMEVIQQRVKRAMQGVHLWTTGRHAENGNRTGTARDMDSSVHGGRRRAALSSSRDVSVRSGKAFFVPTGALGGSCMTMTAPLHHIPTLSSVAVTVIAEGPSLPPAQAPMRLHARSDAPMELGRDIALLSSSAVNLSNGNSSATRVAPPLDGSITVAEPLPVVSSPLRSSAAAIVGSLGAASGEGSVGGNLRSPGGSSRVRAADVGGSPSTIPSFSGPLPPLLQHQELLPLRQSGLELLEGIWPTRDEVSASGLDTLLSVAAAAAVAAVPTLPGLASPSLPQLGDRLLTHGSTLLVALSGDAAAAYAPPNPRSGDTRDDKQQRQKLAPVKELATSVRQLSGELQTEATAPGAAAGPDGSTMEGRDGRTLYNSSRMGWRAALAGAPPPGPVHDVKPSLSNLDMSRIATTKAAVASGRSELPPPLALTRQVRGGPTPHSLSMTRRGRKLAPAGSEALTAPTASASAAAAILETVRALPATTGVARSSLVARHAAGSMPLGSLESTTALQSAFPSVLASTNPAASGPSILAGKPVGGGGGGAAKLKARTLGRALSVRMAAVGDDDSDGAGGDGAEYRGGTGGGLLAPVSPRRVGCEGEPGAQQVAASLTMVNASEFWGREGPYGPVSGGGSNPYTRCGTLPRAHSIRLAHPPHPHPHPPPEVTDLLVSPTRMKPAAVAGSLVLAASGDSIRQRKASTDSSCDDQRASDLDPDLDASPISPVSLVHRISLAPLSPSFTSYTAAAAAIATLDSAVTTLASSGRSPSGRMLVSWPGTQPQPQSHSGSISGFLPQLDGPQPLPVLKSSSTAHGAGALQMQPVHKLEPLLTPSSSTTTRANGAPAAGGSMRSTAASTAAVTVAHACVPMGLGVSFTGGNSGSGAATGEYAETSVPRLGNGEPSPSGSLSLVANSLSPVTPGQYSVAPRVHNYLEHLTSSLSDGSSGGSASLTPTTAAGMHGPVAGGDCGGARGSAVHSISERLTSRTVHLAESEELTPTRSFPSSLRQPQSQHFGRTSKSLSSLTLSCAVPQMPPTDAHGDGGNAAAAGFAQRPLASAVWPSTASVTDLGPASAAAVATASAFGGEEPATAGSESSPLLPKAAPPRKPVHAAAAANGGAVVRPRGAVSSYQLRAFLPDVRTSAAVTESGGRRGEQNNSFTTAGSTRLLPALGLTASGSAAVSVGSLRGRL